MPDVSYDQLTPAQRAQVAKMFQPPWAGDPRRYSYEVNGSGQVISRRRLPAAQADAPSRHKLSKE